MIAASGLLPISRRSLLSGGVATILCAMSGRAATPPSGIAPLAVLASAMHPGDLQTLIASDRGGALWRRAAGRPDLSAALSFRSADRFTPGGTHDLVTGGWWMIDEPVLRTIHAGASGGTSSDSSAAIQAVLDAAAKLGRPVDDTGVEFRVDRSIVLPAGVTWRGARLRAGTPGMNVVLIGSGAQFIEFEISGTGTISHRRGPGPSQVNERAVYPSHEGLRDAVIQGHIRDITIGVHLQPLSAAGPPPANCRIDVELTNIVGQSGTSEGYGVLLSPAEHCNVTVKASVIQRHAVYLSAGASYNTVDAEVTNCFQDAVTIFSLGNQPACVGNTLKVAAKGVRAPAREPVGSNSTCFSIYGKADDNVVHLIATGADAGQRGPYAAALVRGLEGRDGPFPKNNRIFIQAIGSFSGPYVVLATDTIATLIKGGSISARGSVGVIGFSDTRSNSRSFELAGRVSDVSIDAIDSRVPGIVVATERSPVEIDSSVRFSRVQNPARDYTGRLRRGD